jgi:hypothetical protein
MTELQQQVNALGHLNLVVSRLSMRRLQDLQVGLLQEIQNRGEKAHQELMRMMDERVQLQQQYDVVLQQKKEVEARWRRY